MIIQEKRENQKKPKQKNKYSIDSIDTITPTEKKNEK